MSGEPGSSPAPRILLVEDNPGDVYLLRKALEAADVHMELMVIADGAEAISCVAGRGKYAGLPPPALAVLDLNLPKHGGVEVLKAIRENAAWADLPVVVFSSSPSPRDEAEAQAIGVQRYIRKALDLDSFMETGRILKDVLDQNAASA